MAWVLLSLIGSGVAGLTTAYELLAQESGAEVIVLEAKDRTGDTFTEDQDSKLFGSKPGETQVVRFDRPAGDSEPYLNAGPGRSPSSHKRLLGYLKRFGVEVDACLGLDRDCPGGRPQRAFEQIYRALAFGHRTLSSRAPTIRAIPHRSSADRTRPRRRARTRRTC